MSTQHALAGLVALDASLLQIPEIDLHTYMHACIHSGTYDVLNASLMDVLPCIACMYFLTRRPAPTLPFSFTGHLSRVGGTKGGGGLSSVIQTPNRTVPAALPAYL